MVPGCSQDELSEQRDPEVMISIVLDGWWGVSISQSEPRSQSLGLSGLNPASPLC